MTNLATRAVLATAVCAAGCAGRSASTAREDALPPPPVLGAVIDRVGRPLTANALIGLFSSEADSGARKEAYNRAAPRDWGQFAPDLARGLALYDGYDGRCGNQWLAAATGDRYAGLAALLADDRLWVDTRATTCHAYFAVERAALSGGPAGDCGGRTPGDDAIDVIRSMWVDGTATSVSDGVDHDDRVHSTTEFPFLAAP